MSLSFRFLPGLLRSLDGLKTFETPDLFEVWPSSSPSRLLFKTTTASSKALFKSFRFFSDNEPSFSIWNTNLRIVLAILIGRVIWKDIVLYLYYTWMILVWYLYDTCMILVWYLYDTCMILVWYLYDTCMVLLSYLYHNCIILVLYFYYTFIILVLYLYYTCIILV